MGIVGKKLDVVAGVEIGGAFLAAYISKTAEFVEAFTLGFLPMPGLKILAELLLLKKLSISFLNACRNFWIIT